ncbi:MAG: hypothetical protein LBF39_02035 [Prevotellaceae bacterium]|nr:hypothetical protein [Prevotellaceae bacterium]
MEEILKRNGWRLYSNCSCGGTTEMKFEYRLFEGVRIHVRPAQKKWFVKKNNRDVGQGNASNFVEKMVEYGYIQEGSAGV